MSSGSFERWESVGNVELLGRGSWWVAQFFSLLFSPAPYGGSRITIQRSASMSDASLQSLRLAQQGGAGLRQVRVAVLAGSRILSSHMASPFSKSLRSGKRLFGRAVSSPVQRAMGLPAESSAPASKLYSGLQKCVRMPAYPPRAYLPSLVPPLASDCT